MIQYAIIGLFLNCFVTDQLRTWYFFFNNTMIEATCSDSVQCSHLQCTVVVTPKAATLELTQVYSIITECVLLLFHIRLFIQHCPVLSIPDTQPSVITFTLSHVLWETSHE